MIGVVVGGVDAPNVGDNEVEVVFEHIDVRADDKAIVDPCNVGKGVHDIFQDVVGVASVELVGVTGAKAGGVHSDGG